MVGLLAHAFFEAFDSMTRQVFRVGLFTFLGIVVSLIVLLVVVNVILARKGITGFTLEDRES